MLICQAIHHDLFLVTIDDEVTKYPVRIVR
jgi:PIN domain nuclease of toxin-antitoxin system